MEIKEIVSYFLNAETNILEVSFRTIDDNEEVLRNDNIDYTIVGDYGFNLVTESFDFFGEEFEDELKALGLEDSGADVNVACYTDKQKFRWDIL